MADCKRCGGDTKDASGPCPASGAGIPCESRAQATRRLNAPRSRWGTKITPSWKRGYDDGFAGAKATLPKTFSASVAYAEGHEQGRIEAAAEHIAAHRHHEV